MNCSDLDAALKAVCVRTYHLGAPERLTEYEYIVWREYDVGTIYGDDISVVRIPRVQIDAFSQDDTPLDEHPFFGAVMDALDELELAYSVESYDYDDDAALMRLIIQTDVC